MTVTATVGGAPVARRPSRAGRRFGYAVGAVLNGALLYLVNASPGWSAVPFLTAATTDALPLVNASLIAGMVANLCYAAVDPPWLRSLGEVVTTAVGLAALIAVWRVFPFDFDAWSVTAGGALDWDFVARVVLVVAIAGSATAIAVHTVKLAGHIVGACLRR